APTPDRRPIAGGPTHRARPARRAPTRSGGARRAARRGEAPRGRESSHPQRPGPRRVGKRTPRARRTRRKQAKQQTGAALAQACSFVSFVPFVSFEFPSKPEHKLRRWQVQRPHATALARVVLVGDLENEISLDGVAATDLEPGDRRVPRVAPGRADDLAEPEMIEAGGRVETGSDLVAAFDRSRQRAERSVNQRSPS